MQKIIPNLWFAGNTSEAVDFYLSIFKDSKKLTTAYYPNEGLAGFQKTLKGKVLTIDFELQGQRFVAINAGNEFSFSEAVSFAIMCKDQQEIDYYWRTLSVDPSAEQCGWCKDQYGLSWQIVPDNMKELLKLPGAFEVMMQQKKIVIAEYEES